MTIDENGRMYHRELPDGREIAVYMRIYNSIIAIGPTGSPCYDTHYCYDTPVQAIIAAQMWDPTVDPEPEGWFRHADSGRRRPNGDPEKEYFAP